MKKFKCKKCGKIHDEKPEACECEGTEFEEVVVEDPKEPPKPDRALIAKAVKEALEKQEAEHKKVLEALEKKVDLAGLDAAERAKKEKEIEDKKIAEQLAELALLKSREATQKILTERELPHQYAELLAIPGDDETTLKRINSFEELYRADLKKIAEDSMRDKPPGAGGAGGTDNPFKDPSKMAEQAALFKKDPDKARKLASEAGLKI